jgi:alkylhydroperoxidase family enzyme
MTEQLDDLRAVVARVPPAPAAMSAYLEQVRTRAYTVTDGDVEALLAAGCTEDEVFEQTVAAAISEGLRRLDAAGKVLG